MRLAVAKDEPQIILELLVVGLAHPEVGVGLIVEVLVLSPQLLSLPDAVQDEVGRPEAAWHAPLQLLEEVEPLRRSSLDLLRVGKTYKKLSVNKGSLPMTRARRHHPQPPNCDRLESK